VGDGDVYLNSGFEHAHAHTNINTHADHTKKHSVARYGNIHRTHTADKPAVSNNSGDTVLTCTIARWSSPPKTSLIPSHRQSLLLSHSLSLFRSLSAALPLSPCLTLVLSLSSSQSLPDSLRFLADGRAAGFVSFYTCCCSSGVPTEG